MRRIRILLPTYLSIGLGVFTDIRYFPRGLPERVNSGHQPVLIKFAEGGQIMFLLMEQSAKSARQPLIAVRYCG
jgi:hypothetical protein